MKKKISMGICSCFGLILLDQITKLLSEVNLSGTNGVALLPGIFELFYLKNKGAAFGMLANKQSVFIIIAILMTAGASYVYIRIPLQRHYRLLRIITIMIVSGAIGNMIDRIWHQYVIDFLYIKVIDFPVFNLADCYVCIGAVLAVISLFTLYREDNFEFLVRNKEQNSEER